MSPSPLVPWGVAVTRPEDWLTPATLSDAGQAQDWINITELLDHSLNSGFTLCCVLCKRSMSSVQAALSTSAVVRVKDPRQTELLWLWTVERWQGDLPRGVAVTGRCKEGQL